MAKQISLDEIQRIIRAGTFDDLLGAVEGDHLECKAQPYRLDDARGKYELAKDVSSFANAKGGAILIGVQTAKDATLSADIIRKIGAFPRLNLDISRYRDVLKDWIYPNLQKLDIEWFPGAGNKDEGIVAILIGNQGQLWRPFMIKRTVDDTGTISALLFGYAERSLDRSSPMGIEQLHLLLRDGFRLESGGLGEFTVPPSSSSQARLSPKPRFSPKPKVVPSPTVASRTAAGEAREKLLEDQLQKRINRATDAVQLSTRATFALASVPCKATRIPSLFSSRDADVVRLLEDPGELRPSGFGPDAGDNSRIVEEGEARRVMIAGYKLLEIWADGCIVFVADGGADFLSWGNKSGNKLRINQLALIETTYLFIKFVNDVLAKADPKPDTVLYRAALCRMTVEEPAILFPGNLTLFPHGYQEAQGSDKDIVISFAYGTDPRLIAFELVARVYRWFGFDEEKIPYKETTASGKWIVSPDQIVRSDVR